MHVTSDYYRSREHQSEEDVGPVECWGRSVESAKQAQDVEPLCPSKHTLRRLARHYEKSHALKHSA